MTGKFSAKLSVRGGLGGRIKKYFDDLQNTEFNCNSQIPVMVRVTSDAGWNGHSKGELGQLCPKHVSKAFGRRVDTVVIAVKWTDGMIDWGMHMQEKLEVVK